MKRLVLWAVLSPLAAFAQVHKCQIDGKVAYTEAPCPSTAKGTQLNIQTSAAGPDTSKERTESMRVQTLQLMLSNGNIDAARAQARTAEERALVESVARADRLQRKDRLTEIEASQRRHQREIDKGQKARSVLR